MVSEHFEYIISAQCTAQIVEFVNVTITQIGKQLLHELKPIC